MPKQPIAIYIKVPSYLAGVTEALGDIADADLRIVESLDQLPAALEGARALISAGASVYTPEMKAMVDAAGSLEWFQSVSAGNDNMEALGVRQDVIVTGSGGHSAPVVAEHAIALMLAIAHAIPDWERARAKQVWKMPRTGTYKSLYGGTAVVIGLGNIGSEIARRLNGLEMEVIAATRSGSSGPHVDRAVTIDRLADVLPEADAVLIAAPLTKETQGLFGADAFAACREGAYLVNIARGGLVDQPALIAALESGKLGGAAIDVTTPEPLPEGDPLWTAPNLIIVPHIGGSGSTRSPKRLGQNVRANVEAFFAGRPLNNILPYGRQ